VNNIIYKTDLKKTGAKIWSIGGLFFMIFLTLGLSFEARDIIEVLFCLILVGMCVAMAFHVNYLFKKAGVTITEEITFIYNAYSMKKISTNEIEEFYIENERIGKAKLKDGSTIIMTFVSPPDKAFFAKSYLKYEQAIQEMNNVLEKLKTEGQ
jgi:hypothetical protein